MVVVIGLSDGEAGGDYTMVYDYDPNDFLFLREQAFLCRVERSRDRMHFSYILSVWNSFKAGVTAWRYGNQVT